MEAAEQSIVVARGLTQKNFMRTSYKDVDLDIKRGQVFAVRGRDGSGKTALLLTIAGRMRFSSGTLRVLEWDLPNKRNKVQRRVGLGLFDGLNNLQESLTVAEAIGAEFELYGRKPSKDAVLRYVHEWQLDDVAESLVKDITAERRVRLGISLGWVGHPDMIVIDDMESRLTMEQSSAILVDLRRLAQDRGVTVIFGCIERQLAEMADGVCYLERIGA